ncbi:MAG: hypothetical protein H8E16_03230 [Flavobacteriales bacterium]|nr:hypothetical protein [Flavobacteriales bacterium]
MRRLQLYIGTKRVDLFKDESVSLTQTIQNVKDIAKVFTEFTQTFSVPASRKNNKIFQHYYNFDIDFGFDARNKADARLELNDLPFKNGKIKLNSVDLKNNVAHTYHITFFGNTVNLKDVLGDDLLSSLAALDDNSQVYAYQDIVDILQGFPTGNNNIVVPLITHTNRLIYNAGSHTTYDPEATTNNISHHGSGTQNQNGVDWKQFKYALRVQAIIDAIESKYTIANGYGSDIVFSDDFFNDTTNEEFDDLFIWLHRKKGNVETPSFGDASWTLVTELGTETTSGDYDVMTPVANVINGQLTIDTSNGDYSLDTPQVDLLFTPTNLLLAYDIRVTETNTGTTVTENGVSGQYPFYTNEQLPDGTYTIEIRSDVLVQFGAGGIKWTLDAEERDDEQQSLNGSVVFENAATFGTSAVFEFNITQQIPKIKIIDFLSGMFKMFNLTAFVNDVGTIVVRTLDSYYAAGSQTPINIDKYLDTKTSKVEVALPFKEINFSYKGLGTLFAKQFEQIYNSGWGSRSYKLNNRIYDAPTENYKVELPFEHMQYERLYDIDPSGSGASTTVQYGYFVDDNFEPYYGEPLLFYPILNNGTSIRIRDYDTGAAPDDITRYFIPSNSLALSCPTSKVNIHFQNEYNEYTVREVGDPGCFTDTLFETKYKTYIQDVFNEKRRLIKVTAYLPMKVYYDLELNDLIQLGQDNYKINSMKTDLTSGKTELELLNTIL